MQRRRFLFGLGSTGAAVFALRSGVFARDGVGPVVRVRLFAADELKHVDISNVHLDATSQITQITAESGPLEVVAYKPDGTSIERHYAGSIISSTVDGKLTLVNEVDLESYVASVLASEISSRWHPEALKAQAIAVRTYALRRMRHKHPATYDVVDTTSNQVYRGVDAIVPSLAAAASATAGQSIAFEGGPADVWYHSACGGHTAASAELTGKESPPYLRGIVDNAPDGRAYCASSPYYTWRNTLSAASVARVAQIAPSSITSISVADRWPDGRARTIRVTPSDGAPRDLDGRAFYARAGAVLGYKVVPSALFDIAAAPDAAYVISGRGVGHGVGMCQWGAQGRAKDGQTAAQILAAYFPGTGVTAVTF